MSQFSIDTFELTATEFTATEARLILQDLFPSRKLVLSQLTFYNHAGVGRPSGEKVFRGRKCYKIFDLLPIGLVLALKEQGIPNKNVALVPQLIREHSSCLFSVDGPCLISGIGEVVHLSLPGSDENDPVTETLLSGASMELYWSFDVGALAKEIARITVRLMEEGRFEKIVEEQAPSRTADFSLKLAAG